MKKILILVSILLFLSSCSTYYGKYDYNQYFQNNEPFITVDSEEEAARFIARKLARRFKQGGYKTIAILNFTDEYGDRINRGDFFAGMIVSGLTGYRNPIVVERASLYEIVKERELSQTNLINNKGYEIQQLVQADYILHGRILRGRYDDMISVRCFKVGTGEVVYATTVSIDYTPDPIYVPVPVPVPQPPRYPNPPTGPNPPTETPDEEKEPITKPKPKPADGTEGQGKIDLGDKKKPKTDQYQYKKKPVTTPTVKKPISVKPKSSVIIKNTAVKKAAPVAKEVIKYKEPVEEEKEEKSKENSKTSIKKTTTTTKKSTTIKK